MAVTWRGIGITGLVAGALVAATTGSPTLARRYINTVKVHPLSTWVFNTPTAFYAANLDYGANSRQAGITRHLVATFNVDDGGGEYEVHDPREPDFRYRQIAKPLRSFLLRDVHVHVPSATPIIHGVSPNDGRTVGLTAGDGGYSVTVPVRDLFRRRHEQAPSGFTWISIPRSTNYFHWFSETLPMLIRGVQCCEEDNLPQSAFIDPGGLPTWAHHSLQPLNVPIWAPDKAVVECPSVMLIGCRTQFTLTATDISLIRGCLLDTVDTIDQSHPTRIPPTPAGGIFVTRSSATRSTAAMVALEQALAHHGFLIVDTAKLTLKQQIALFASSHMIVAANGAGLLNAAWLPTGSTVVELQPTDYFDTGRIVLARAAGHRYEYVDVRDLDSNDHGAIDALAAHIAGLLPRAPKQ